jgi:hypothetical protein
MGKMMGLGLNLTNVNNKKSDFQDEFCAKYNEFSESWRKQMNREKRFWLHSCEWNAYIYKIDL